ncbi:hypothetical protein ACFPL7_15960 [Dongia soli]|uniref:Uncharacterized protein n=1 Tax=Dongia soli TaxID=600628 RepID=A0ABU5EDT1_9PROT|nr:hypothetical protein [Dongia soli]MDY0883608.1 hypothetical protein [Dongia soli]
MSQVDWLSHLLKMMRNASKTEPTKLLAVFVLDTNDNILTTPINEP